VFVLVARDRLAAEAVRERALMAEKSGVHADRTGEAYALADRMDVWREAHGGGKIPD
jgi:hypothetical protein